MNVIRYSGRSWLVHTDLKQPHVTEFGLRKVQSFEGLKGYPAFGPEPDRAKGML